MSKKHSTNKTNYIKRNVKKNWKNGVMVASVLVPLATGIGPVFALADDSSPKPATVKSTGTKIKVDDSALKKAIADAKASGVVITPEQTSTQTVEFSKHNDAQKSIADDYQAQIAKINEVTQKQIDQNNKYADLKAQYDAAKAQYDKDKAAYDIAKSQYDKDKEAYDTAMNQYQKDDKAYQTAKSQYDKDKMDYDNAKSQYDKDKSSYDTAKVQYDKELDAFNHGTKVNTTMKALTQSYSDIEKFSTFMKAGVNQQTGEFTLTHDMNDGVSIIGNGELKGKFNWNVKSKGDGSEVIVINSVTLNAYTYTNKNKNTAVNKNINFHVYDTSGRELFTVAHDGEGTFTKDINQTIQLDKSFTLNPGEKTDLTQFLKVDDNWIYNTHGQVYAQFENINKKPTEPKAPTEPTSPTEPKAPTQPEAPTEPKAPAPAPKVPEKPAPLSANYKLADLYITPQPTKDVDEGENAGDKQGSDNNKVVNKGDKLTYSLKATSLLAGRTDDVKVVKYSDKLPKEVDYKTTKLFSEDGKTELTDKFNIQYDKASHTVTVTAKDTFVSGVNKDKTKDYPMPIVNIYAVANKSNAHIDNKFDYWLDDSKTLSNATHNTTPDVKPTKDIDLGVNNGDKQGSDNKKKIVKGQDLTYSLKSTDLPANRAFDVTLHKYVDKLPKEVDYKGAKVFSQDGRTDLSNNYDITYDDKTHTVTAVAKDDFIKSINADKTKAFAKPILNLYATANADGSSFQNKYTEFVNNDSNDSNIVKNTTPTVQPDKQDLDDNNKDINGQEVKPKTMMKYQLTWDLTDKKDLTVPDDTMAKGLSFSDDYDETRLDITAKTKTDFTIIDNETKNSVAAETTVTWDENAGKWTVKANDPKAFLQAHAGHKLTIVFRPVVKANAPGTLVNTAVQNDFSQEYQTQTVKNNVTPNPQAPETPNTSYGEKPKGGLYAGIAAALTGLASIVFFKPISRCLKK